MKKLPSSETHPLNELRHKYFDSDVKNEIGLKMFLVIILTNALSQAPAKSHDKLKRLKLAQLVELIYLAFEIQVKFLFRFFTNQTKGLYNGDQG